MNIVLYLILGFVAGILGGLMGIGGGIIIIPALVYVFHQTQHEAQGTSLAILLLPIGILAVWTYYKAGNVDLKIAGFVALGFVFGGLVGAKAANVVPDYVLKRSFAIFLIITALKMFVDSYRR